MKPQQEAETINLIIDNIASTSFDDLDEAAVENAKCRVIDTVGCLLGGAKDPGNEAFVSMMRDIGGKPEASIMVFGDKIPLGNVAMVNSILARLFDFEPESPAIGDRSFPGHVSGSTVMTAISVGESQNATGKEMITALLLGDDLAKRILHSTGFDINRGWDNIGIINALGTTAIAGKLLGLNKKQLAWSFGIILNQLAGSMQIVWDATTSFKICQGLVSKNGIFSAKMAALNWTAREDALFSSYGYYNLYSNGCDNPEVLTEKLGVEFSTDKTFKPYPCCRIVHAAVNAALIVARENVNDSEEIDWVELGVSKVIQNNAVARPFEVGRFRMAARRLASGIQSRRRC